MTRIPALGRQRQTELCDLETSLVYIEFQESKNIDAQFDEKLQNRFREVPCLETLPQWS